ncbi:MAG: nickel pincer cofactor biosynthesis protein LarC, partial [Planctomycetes bacterium]|nr:nickel pincer cofactor biosynthesis protein LarC [Planctomycetota bacterium]
RWEIAASIRERAGRIFARLAEAEGRVHGVDPGDVQFHEVGALDSIVDICGAACALDLLGIDAVYSAPIGVGGGVRRMAHGLVPIPAPATAEILTGLPSYRSGVDGELLTPTGAAILAEIVTAFSAPPGVWRLCAVGYGAGSNERSDPPNVVRVMLQESAEAEASSPATVVELVCQVDDMSGEELGFLRERLETLGALDLVYEPVQMKKNRPGVRVELLCEPAREAPLVEALLRESSTFGLRRRSCERVVLDREWVTVATVLGTARVKIGRRDGRLHKFAAEYEDCRRLALESGRPFVEVRRIVESAFDPDSVPASS